MKSSVRRMVTGSGTLLIAAAVVLLPAQAAQADAAYYGAWELTGWKIGSTKIDCPGTLPLPAPAPAIQCKGGEVLELRSNYRYSTNLEIFGDALLSRGAYATVRFPGSTVKTVIFDADGTTDDPRAYKMKLQGTSSGMPTKMKIFISVGAPGGGDTPIKMIFRRDS